ncbi:MAG: polyprenyl synthetase family protein [Cypionkella sp.]
MAEQIDLFEPEVAEGARYALSASGKQLRPVLVALGAQAAGGLTPAHVTGAAIVELVHLATLVHDDVIDAAGLRRQRPTVAARFGNQTAVLLGRLPVRPFALQLASPVSHHRSLPGGRHGHQGRVFGRDPANPPQGAPRPTASTTTFGSSA